MPSEVYEQYMLNPRDFTYLNAYGAWKADKQEREQRSTESQQKLTSLGRG